MTDPLELIVDGELTLRQFCLENAPAIFALIDGSRAHLSQYGEDTADKYLTLQDVEHSISSPPNPDRLRLGIWDGESLVGSINLTPDGPGAAAIGYYVGAHCEGKGYVTRAVRRLLEYGHGPAGYVRVYAYVLRQNFRSRAVLDRTGFRLEAVETLEGRLRYMHRAG